MVYDTGRRFEERIFLILHVRVVVLLAMRHVKHTAPFFFGTIQRPDFCRKQYILCTTFLKKLLR